MSFVKNAVKKVFKVVKKVVKKTVSFVKRAVKSDWFKIAVVVGLSLFTAGLASGGFAAMGQGITGFFQSVGATMAKGFTAITGKLAAAGSKIGSMFGAASTTTSTAAASMTTAEALSPVLLSGSAVPMAGGTVSAATMSSLSMAELAGLAATGAAPGAAGLASTGIMGTLKSFGSALVPDTAAGKFLLANTISSGFDFYQKQKAAEAHEGYYRNRNIWGNAAYGGGDYEMDFLMPTLADKSVAAGAEEGLLPFEQQQQDQQRQQVATPQEQQAAQMAQAGGPQQGLLGVPGQQTQPPPATQPQDPSAPPPPPGSQLENMV